MQQKVAFQGLLACRNSTGLKKFMEDENFPSQIRDAFFQLSRCRRLGEVSSISLNNSKYDKLNKQLESLLELQETLVDYRIDNFVFFDFSLTKKIEYYTGIVFEASVPNLGLPLGGGGRYDNFIEKFGKLKLPATGFALEIGKLIQALTSQGFNIPDETKPRVIVASKFRKTALEAIKALQESGSIASLEVTSRSLEKTMEYARLTDMDYVVSVGSSLKSPITVYNLKSNISRGVLFGTFLREIGGQY
jgi:ATP phosphoribosyltransferase regulatory subunit